MSNLLRDLLALKSIPHINDQERIAAVGSAIGLSIKSTRSFSTLPSPTYLSQLKEEHQDHFDQGLVWAEQQLERSRLEGYQVIHFFDPRYPPLLRLIPTPPLILFALGHLQPLQQQPQLAIVGTRTPSAIGLDHCRISTRRAAEHHIGVVSGLAYGIDQAAHCQMLACRGYTAAILGHGFQTIYPSVHRPLANKLLRHGGALLTEHPWDTPPRPHHFVLRNRLQSGLTAATLIVEARDRGGTLHTGRAAIRQQRPLWLTAQHRTRLNDPIIHRSGVTWLDSEEDLNHELLTLPARYSYLSGQGQLSDLKESPSPHVTEQPNLFSPALLELSKNDSNSS